MLCSWLSRIARCSTSRQPRTGICVGDSASVPRPGLWSVVWDRPTTVLPSLLGVIPQVFPIFINFMRRGTPCVNGRLIPQFPELNRRAGHRWPNSSAVEFGGLGVPRPRLRLQEDLDCAVLLL